VAAVALAHGVNANLVRKWLIGRGFKGGVAVVTDDAPTLTSAKIHGDCPMPQSTLEAMRFVPVGVAAEVITAGAPPIEVELRRGDASMLVRWPISQAQGCAAWLGAVAGVVLKG
jgi:hypothetical protein